MTVEDVEPALFEWHLLTASYANATSSDGVDNDEVLKFTSKMSVAYMNSSNNSNDGDEHTVAIRWTMLDRQQYVVAACDGQLEIVELKTGAKTTLCINLRGVRWMEIARTDTTQLLFLQDEHDCVFRLRLEERSNGIVKNVLSNWRRKHFKLVKVRHMLPGDLLFVHDEKNVVVYRKHLGKLLVYDSPLNRKPNVEISVPPALHYWIRGHIVFCLGTGLHYNHISIVSRKLASQVYGNLDQSCQLDDVILQHIPFPRDTQEFLRTSLIAKAQNFAWELRSVDKESDLIAFLVRTNQIKRVRSVMRAFHFDSLFQALDKPHEITSMPHKFIIDPLDVLRFLRNKLEFIAVYLSELSMLFAHDTEQWTKSYFYIAHRVACAWKQCHSKLLDEINSCDKFLKLGYINDFATSILIDLLQTRATIVDAHENPKIVADSLTQLVESCCMKSEWDIVPTVLLRRRVFDVLPHETRVKLVCSCPHILNLHWKDDDFNFLIRFISRLPSRSRPMLFDMISQHSSCASVTTLVLLAVLREEDRFVEFLARIDDQATMMSTVQACDSFRAWHYCALLEEKLSNAEQCGNYFVRNVSFISSPTQADTSALAIRLSRLRLHHTIRTETTLRWAKFIIGTWVRCQPSESELGNGESAILEEILLSAFMSECVEVVLGNFEHFFTSRFLLKLSHRKYSRAQMGVVKALKLHQLEGQSIRL